MKKKKELIIFIPSIEDGGVEKNLYLITNYLSTKIDNICLITANTNKKKEFSKKINFISPNSFSVRFNVFFCSVLMTTFYEEIEIEDFVFDEEKNLFHYPCPCGDRFEVTLVSLKMHI